ncbi:MAG: patatin-like phospholipase family protein [Paludibacteraceae bacterium]
MVIRRNEIASFFEGMEFRKMAQPHIPDGGFFKMNNFEKFMEKKLRARTFEELKIPLRVVATNLDKGKSVVFSKGKLIPPIIGSASVPVLFSPRIIDGDHFVDGGVFQNFPVSTIRKECEKVIGINASPLVVPNTKMNVVNVAQRSYHFMFKANILHDKELCDILIEPTDVANYEMFDTQKSRDIFELGYNTAKKIL